jgi:hypothetical protein
MIGIFYPYLESAGKWEELRYSLRSLERFFGEECEVWIVGDLPDWIQNVKHIAHRKNMRIYNSSNYDAVSKLAAYMDHPDSPERFVRMYDDVYFIGERTLRDLEVTRYLFTYSELRSGEFASGSIVWRDQVNRTVVAVKDRGYWGYMTETHCPEVFEKQKMREIFTMFDPAENMLLTSTLYYNVFPFVRLLKDRKTERALFYGKENEFSFLASPSLENVIDGQKVIEKKYFLNHNDAGLDENLKGYIRGMFPEKCRWEK